MLLGQQYCPSCSSAALQPGTVLPSPPGLSPGLQSPPARAAALGRQARGQRPANSPVRQWDVHTDGSQMGITRNVLAQKAVDLVAF